MTTFELMAYRSDRRGDMSTLFLALIEAVDTVGAPRANTIMAPNQNVPLQRPEIRMQSTCRLPRTVLSAMLNEVFEDRTQESCAYLTEESRYGKVDRDWKAHTLSHGAPSGSPPSIDDLRYAAT